MNEMIQKLKEIFNNNAKVRFAILFGSYARGTQRSDSDLDIAVSFEDGTYNKEVLRLNLMAELSRLATRVDLLPIENLNPLLAYKVASQGIVIFTQNNDYVTNFRAKAFGEYPDYQKFMNTYNGAMLSRIEENTFGG